MLPPPQAPLGFQVPSGTADQHLLDYIAKNRFGRVFLVSGHRSFSWFEEKGFIDKLSDIADVARWSEARPNPDFADLTQGLEAVSAHAPDVIIGVGGGSVLDAAKLLAALYKKPHSTLDTLLTNAPDLDSRNIALVLVPTTAGSGAEATHFSVLYRDGVKYSVAGQALLPDHTVLDPHLVTGGSPQQLAASGLDALCQCVESLWARGSTTESRKLAEEGLGVVAKSLVHFVNGNNECAGDMQWGSHLSGHAINTSKTTASHALSYFLTTRQGVPHGIAVASTLGYFIDHHTRTAASSHSSHGVFAEAIKAIRVGLGLRDNDSALEYFRRLFAEIGLNEPEDYWPQDPAVQDEWMNSANPERLGNHPEPLESKDLYEILRLES